MSRLPTRHYLAEATAAVGCVRSIFSSFLISLERVSQLLLLYFSYEGYGEFSSAPPSARKHQNSMSASMTGKCYSKLYLWDYPLTVSLLIRSLATIWLIMMFDPSEIVNSRFASRVSERTFYYRLLLGACMLVAGTYFLSSFRQHLSAPYKNFK